MKINNQFSSIEQVTGRYLKQQNTVQEAKTAAPSFEDIFRSKWTETDTSLENRGVRFSKHAVNRLSDRNIQLTNEQIERLESGAKKAGEKGIQESLVLVDQLAFIVNVKNNTVITAMEQNETSDKVFTNIDGAVIM